MDLLETETKILLQTGGSQLLECVRLSWGLVKIQMAPPAPKFPASAGQGGPKHLHPQQAPQGMLMLRVQGPPVRTTL